VLDAFVAAFGPDAPMRRRADGSGKGHVDLRECLRRQLLAAGVDEAGIDTTDRCTYRDRDEFYSHRRDHGVTGRMAAIIAPRG
jgi:copper oxidase (laccase) domain-containing protein